MDVGAVLYVLGRLCTMLAVLLLAPLALCVAYDGLGTSTANAFVVSAAVSLGLGLALRLSFDFRPDDFGFGEAFATVTASWILFTALGAMPFVITGAIPTVVDACFEVLSGFTTTGASILADPGLLAEPLLFWRALTQWVGGMGIVMLSVAVLPALGAGGSFLFHAEVPGPEAEKLLPRISSTAKLLWTLYLTLTASQCALLWVAGMEPLDSICHTFATVATGGFGTRADSLNSYSPAIQWIVTGYMFLAGVNFVLLLGIMRGRWELSLRNTELRVYTLIAVGVSLLCALVLYQQRGAAGGLEPLLRDASFTAVSVLTSTGFVTSDFGAWPMSLQGILLLLMVCGACAGSTGGGAKVIRLVMWIKTGVREVRRLLRPRAVFVVKVGGKAIPDDLVSQVSGFLVLYLVTALVFTVLLLLLGHDGPTAISAVLSCLSNVGPGLAEVGPTENYAGFSQVSKLLLMFCMLLGRLEFYSVLVLLVPLAWKR